MTDIYFIRHGQASFGTPDYDRLSELGIRQVNVLAEYLIDMEAYFAKIYSGTNRRQVETVDIMLNRFDADDIQTPYSKNSGLDEFDMIRFLNTHKEAVIRCVPEFAGELKSLAARPELFQSLLAKSLLAITRQTGGGEAFETFCPFRSRVLSTVRKIVDESRTFKKTAVVTSGGVLAVIMQHIYGLTDEAAVQWALQSYNASITVCHVNGNTLEMKLENSVVHLRQTHDHTLLTWV
ncbi:MAG: histidine phosphatase family protein [Desulfobacterales bacterium]